MVAVCRNASKPIQFVLISIKHNAASENKFYLMHFRSTMAPNTDSVIPPSNHISDLKKPLKKCVQRKIDTKSGRKDLQHNENKLQPSKKIKSIRDKSEQHEESQLSQTSSHESEEKCSVKGKTKAL